MHILLLSLFNSMTIKRASGLAALFVFVQIISACSIPVNDVSITGKGRPNFNAVFVKTNFNATFTGTTTVVPVSTSLKMSDHGISQGAQRTASSSTSLRMTSGIGLQ
jgi:hypothetical protein